MTLGDMIREYLANNSMADFSRESGLSRAYAYMLIKNKNNNGGKIVPTIETVRKVAKGIHVPFDDVIARLDDNITLTVNAPKETEEDRAILEAYHNATPFVQRMVLYTLGLEGGEDNGEG